MEDLDKISILMPTYNDANYIRSSINSILNQTYENWELILVNDGSTDETDEIIKTIHDPRIKYIVQENKGQLNALLTGSQFIEGDIVLLFHSDDELAYKEVFVDIIETFSKNPEIDGLYADYIIIDKDGNETGMLKVSDTVNESEVIRKVFFHKGDNLIGDTFIVKRDIFTNYVIPNYIFDNTIYYVNYKTFTVLNLKKIQPWYKYRVFEENYIHSEIGKFEVANGTFRTIYKLLANNFKTGPVHIFSSLFTLKVFRKLKLYRFFKVEKGPKIDKKLAYKLFSLWKQELINKQYPELSIKQISKIIDSLKSIGNYEKKLYINKDEINSIKYIYYGKDARQFYKVYHSGELDVVFRKILDQDYDYIAVESEEVQLIVKKILKFYSLFYDVKVEGKTDV